jgi:hypothetical protein
LIRTQLRVADRLKKSWREVRLLDLEELTYWIAYDRIYPADDGWITSAKLIQTVLGVFGVQASADQIYPHLRPPAPPAEDPDLMYAKFAAWATWHNAIIARNAADTQARAEATAAAAARMKETHGPDCQP